MWDHVLSIFNFKRELDLKLLGSMVLFLICAAGIGLPFLLLIWRPAFVGFDETGLRQAYLLEKRASEIDTIMFGDSMMSMSFYPDKPHIFNFASPGDTVADMREKAAFSILKVKGFKTAIVELDLHMFSADRASQEQKNRFAFMDSQKNGISQSISCYLYQCCDEGVFLSDVRCSLNQYRRAVIDARRSAGTPKILNSGFTYFSHRLQWDLSASDVKLNAEVNSDVPDANMVKQFLEFIDFLKANNLRVVIATPPNYYDEAKSFYSHNTAVRNEYFKKYKMLEKAHDFCDGASVLGTNKRLYVNSSHASIEGAKIYSQFVAECLRSGE